MKNLLALTLGLSLVSILAACGGGAEGNKASPKDAGSDATTNKDTSYQTDSHAWLDANPDRDGSIASADTTAYDVTEKDAPTEAGAHDLASNMDSLSPDASPPDTVLIFPDVPNDVGAMTDQALDSVLSGLDVPALDAPIVDVWSADVAINQSPDVAVPLHGTTWTAYAGEFLGAARVKATMTLTATTFEETIRYWTGTDWRNWLGLRGTLSTSSTDVYSATLMEIGVVETGTAFTWSPATGSAFDAIREHVWGVANPQPMRLTPQGSTLSLQRDCDNNHVFDDAYDTSLTWFPRFASTAVDEEHEDKAGTYPHLQYVGLNFHGQANSFSTYLQVGQSFGGTPLSVSMDFSGPGGVSFPNQAATFHADRGEWGFDSYVLPTTPTAGIWWVSRISITMDNGGKASYSAPSPFARYTGTYTTDMGATGTIASLDTLTGQDYLPPATGTFYYIDTFANPSTTSARVDPGLKVFAEDDLVHWIARNDDRLDIWAGLKIPFLSGKKYFICAEDFYGNGNSYSIRISNTGFGGTSQGTATLPDSGEPDDTPNEAREIRLNQVVDRSFKRSEMDWFYFVAP